VLIGVLAGGRGQRMGGRDKAALLAPGGAEALLPRLLRLCRELDLQAVVVGGAHAADVPLLPDEPAGIGPLGGLAALLAHAGERPALALACDLPYLGAELLARLAHAPSRAAVLAPRDRGSGKWQPLFARYDSPRVLPELRAAITAGTRSFQQLLGRLAVEDLVLSEAEHAQLRDWDSPDDMR